MSKEFFKALSITIVCFALALFLYPTFFAVPFYRILGFNSFMFMTDRESVLTRLCSQQSEDGFGLPVFIGNVIYLGLSPLIILVCFYAAFRLWENSR
jgi:hypothetical protein